MQETRVRAYQNQDVCAWTPTGRFFARALSAVLFQRRGEPLCKRRVLGVAPTKVVLRVG